MLSLVDRFQESLMSIRGSEPTPECFDNIQVNAYGSMTPLKAVGQVVIASPTLAQITCLEPSAANDFSKAFQLALELNPQVDKGGMVKVWRPRVSMDVRQQSS
jgi:ribosome recycling factor